MVKVKYTQEELEIAIKESNSFRSVAKKLNLSFSNPSLRENIKKYDISHFTKSKPGNSKYFDLIGKKFNRLLLISIQETPNESRKYNYGLFKCDCGNEKIILICNVIKNRTISCGCAHKDTCKIRDEEVLNKRFYKLKVLKVYRKDNIRFGFAECLCDCGNICQKSIPCLKRYKNFGCKQCSLKVHSEINQLEKNPSWKGFGKISARFVWNIKRSAERRELQFNIEEITPKFLWELLERQNFKCALSGEKLYIINIMKTNEYNISLDRIDSSKGYLKDNVQWVTKDVNLMKKQFSDEKFIEICKMVVENSLNKD